MAHWTLHWSGAQVVMTRLSAHFRKRGDHVAFVTTVDPGHAADEFKGHCDDLWHCGREAGETTQAYLARFHGMISIRGYDLLMTHHSLQAVGVAGTLPSSVATLSVLHEHPFDGMGYIGLMNRKAFDAYVGVSRGVADAAREVLGPTVRVECIPNGVEPGCFSARAERDFLDVLFVGRLIEAHKGIMLLPQIAELARQRGLPVRLEVIGDGIDRPVLEAEVERLQLGEVVTLRGALPREKALAAMERADVLVMPSHHEGLALVLLEAMGRGCIPVVTDLPDSMGEVVTSGIDGVLVKPRTAGAFAEVLMRLWLQPADRKVIGERAYANALGRTEEKMLERYADLVDDLRELPRSRKRRMDWTILDKF